MSGENPCKVCNAKDMASGCRNCVLDTIGVSRECRNDECFLNYECGCLLSLDENCKASTAYPDSIKDHFCDECVNYKESKDGECICKEDGQEIDGYDGACNYFKEREKADEIMG